MAAEPDPSALIWLLGQPQLGDYLRFVADKVAGGKAIPPADLVAEWRQANDVFYELEQHEAGIADQIAVAEPEARLRPLVAAVEASPWFRHAFGALPTRILKVELDKLVVAQAHVERGTTYARVTGAGRPRSAAALFRVCLPLDTAPAPVRVRRLGSGRYALSSPSTDFRAHEPELVTLAAGASGKEGPAVASLSVAVGFGCNFMSAIRSGSRLVLQNGHHRAFALRSAGFTHAYCVVEDVTRKDELRITASPEVSADPEFYFAAARPPLLRDFFDPRLTKALPVLPIEFEVEIEVKVRQSNVVHLSA